MGRREAARSGWAPRDAPAATRLGLALLLAGVALHVGLLVALGPARSNATVQLVALAAQVATCAAVARWSVRLPSGTWAGLVLVVTPVIGLLPPFYPQVVLLAVPLLFLLVVFSSHALGAGVARLVTAQAVLVAVRVAWQLHGDVALSVVDVLFVGGVLVLVHGLLVRGADAQELLVSRLEREARYDGLTGVLARQAFEDGVDRALLGTAGPTGLLLVDVDHFKAVNDTHGHPVGDAALRHVAELVSAGVRRSGGVVGRLGGDELGVLLVDCTAEVAAERADALVRQLRASPLRTGEGLLVGLTLSIGAAATDRGGRIELYAAADAALYDAKRAGRDRASVRVDGDRRSGAPVVEPAADPVVGQSSPL
ncbi:diguanylate cyclase [Modestobacter sp. Leaf380]|uniref:GGDEF domain-containing protein n=1 Tax=Modestobacter sp. Leaf380 TaxID=1736356 RepID=UPI0006FA83C9|nr:diguanylate cyclase [Modestobacter sp. Leaf380]KQS71126.1 hypothetical protein ASG41_20445 [Modestobacter sp. Leaf380]